MAKEAENRDLLGLVVDHKIVIKNVSFGNIVDSSDCVKINYFERAGVSVCVLVLISDFMISQYRLTGIRA